jgi:hypothetical protein
MSPAAMSAEARSHRHGPSVLRLRRVAHGGRSRSNVRMSQQPENPDPGVDSSLDAGLAESDAQGEQAVEADLQSGTSQRTDPDDPEAAIEEATERSRGQD